MNQEFKINEIAEQFNILKDVESLLKIENQKTLLKEYEGKYIFSNANTYYKLITVDASGRRMCAFGVDSEWGIQEKLYSGRWCRSPFFKDFLFLYEIENATVITKEEFVEVVNEQLGKIKSNFLSEDE